MPATRFQATVMVAAFALVAVACDDGPDDAVIDDAELVTSDDELLDLIDDMSDAEFDEFVDSLSDDDYDRLVSLLESEADEPDDEPENDPDEFTDGARDDVDCDADALGDDDVVAFTTAHFVVDGELGDVCFGERDDRLVAAWDALAVFVPQGQLADLGLFGGFDQLDSGDDVTLAFVNALDDDRTLFQMSVNLDAAESDPAEAQLTLAHEFSHVFTALPSQAEYTVEAIDECTTYFNGDGCYTDDSIMWRWIQEFWGGGLIDEVDPLEEATADGGQARCDDDPGFFGAYAASNPEEDFAESFSAYVLAIETFTPGQDARLDWIDAQPGLAEFRQRAADAGIPSPPNNFDECGLG